MVLQVHMQICPHAPTQQNQLGHGMIELILNSLNRLETFHIIIFKIYLNEEVMSSRYEASSLIVGMKYFEASKHPSRVQKYEVSLLC